MKRSAKSVDDQSCQCFAFDILSDNKQRLALLDDLLENGNDFLDVRDFLFEDQDVSIFEDAFHGGRIGHEIRREVTSVKLHPFDEFKFVMEALAFVDRYHTVLANAFHGICEQVTDSSVVVRSDRSDVGHLGLVLDLDRHLLELLGDIRNGLLDTSLHLNRIHTGNNRFEPFVENRFGHDRGSGCSIASNVAGLRGHFAYHASAHVLVNIFEVDFLSDRNTVFGHCWATERLLQNNVPTAWSECYLDCPSEFTDTTSDRFAGFLIKSNDFCHSLRMLLDEILRFGSVAMLGLPTDKNDD